MQDLVLGAVWIDVFERKALRDDFNFKKCPFNCMTNYNRVQRKGAGKRGLECGMEVRIQLTTIQQDKLYHIIYIVQ